MKVYMRRNAAASYGCKLTEGETGDVPAELGKQLIADGIAESAADREKAEAEAGEIRGVPNKPEIGESEGVDIVQRTQPTPANFGKNPHSPQGKK